MDIGSSNSKKPLAPITVRGSSEEGSQNIPVGCEWRMQITRPNANPDYKLYDVINPTHVQR